jgi:RNA polymerase primary sigma factor
MVKKRKGKENTRTTDEFPQAQLDDGEEMSGDFDYDDIDDDDLGEDDSFFDGGPLKDEDAADILLSDEDDLEDLDENLLEEGARLDSFALADDPVRMYLKEIGQVPLLDTNRETWLSAQIAAERLLEHLTDKLSNPQKGEGLPSRTRSRRQLTSTLSATGKKC